MFVGWKTDTKQSFWPHASSTIYHCFGSQNFVISTKDMAKMLPGDMPILALTLISIILCIFYIFMVIAINSQSLEREDLFGSSQKPEIYYIAMNRTD